MHQQLADATSEWIGKRHSLTLRQTPRWAHSFILILVIFGGAAIAASLIIKIDEVVTVQGRLRPIGGTREVLSPVTATLESVRIREGSMVAKDQILATYDTRDAAIRERNLEEQLTLSRRSKLQNLSLNDTERKALERSLLFSQDITSRFRYLAKVGAQSDLSYISQKKQMEDIQSELVRLSQKRQEIELQFNQRIRSMESELAQVKLLLANSVLRAPIAGTVFDLTRSARQVTSLGQPMLKIVPADAAKAEVFVSNQDIGFVRTGQASQVRVDAYPFTKFGELKGNVTRIGADVLEPDEKNPTYRFPVEITLNTPVLRSQGIVLPLKPGMSVQANLKLREKRVISLLTDMFSKNIDGLKSLRG
jgi:hemolysin D